ncbi:hypothetical protein DXV76_08430 [Rhodobacteraceae bacterium CCMM004]|nr:hypothetical protein DXV76_08430 [Rhodobacteraceae bacterium CCMM004]
MNWAIFLALAVYLLAPVGNGGPPEAVPAAPMTVAGTQTLPGLPAFSNADLIAPWPKVVHVTASWCTTCRDEVRWLATLPDDVPVFRLGWRDGAEGATAPLDAAYDGARADPDGAAAGWGVTGIPETLVLGPEGAVVARHLGTLTEAAMTRTVLPALER